MPHIVHGRRHTERCLCQVGCEVVPFVANVVGKKHYACLISRLPLLHSWCLESPVICITPSSFGRDQFVGLQPRKPNKTAGYQRKHIGSMGF